MSTLTIELDSALASALEASARREHKPVAAWASERLRLATMEATAEVNAYPPGWLKLFGAVDDDSFVAPARTDTREVEALDLD